MWGLTATLGSPPPHRPPPGPAPHLLHRLPLAAHAAAPLPAPLGLGGRRGGSVPARSPLPGPARPGPHPPAAPGRGGRSSTAAPRTSAPSRRPPAPWQRAPSGHVTPATNESAAPPPGPPSPRPLPPSRELSRPERVDRDGPLQLAHQAVCGTSSLLPRPELPSKGKARAAPPAGAAWARVDSQRRQRPAASSKTIAFAPAGSIILPCACLKLRQPALHRK